MSYCPSPRVQTSFVTGYEISEGHWSDSILCSSIIHVAKCNLGQHWMTRLLRETTLSVSTKQKQQSNIQVEKRATIKETKKKRLSESMVSVNDDCQGRELKQRKLRETETYRQVWFPSHVVLMLSHSTSKILDWVVLACTSMHAGL